MKMSVKSTVGGIYVELGLLGSTVGAYFHPQTYYPQKKIEDNSSLHAETGS